MPAANAGNFFIDDFRLMIVDCRIKPQPASAINNLESKIINLKCYEPRSMVVVFRFPDDDDLIDRNVTTLTLIIAQVNDTRLDAQNLAAQTRRAAAVKVDLLSDESSEQLFHKSLPIADCRLPIGRDCDVQWLTKFPESSNRQSAIGNRQYLQSAIGNDLTFHCET